MCLHRGAGHAKPLSGPGASLGRQSGGLHKSIIQPISLIVKRRFGRVFYVTSLLSTSRSRQDPFRGFAILCSSVCARNAYKYGLFLALSLRVSPLERGTAGGYCGTAQLMRDGADKPAFLRALVCVFADGTVLCLWVLKASELVPLTRCLRLLQRTAVTALVCESSCSHQNIISLSCLTELEVP